MKLSLLETVVYHRMLWAELADTGEKYKTHAKFWNEQKIKHEDVRNWCFPCDYDRKLASETCCSCPFNETDGCSGTSAVFNWWDFESDRATRKRLDAIIRNWPLKDWAKKELGE